MHNNVIVSVFVPILFISFHRLSLFKVTQVFPSNSNEWGSSSLTVNSWRSCSPCSIHRCSLLFRVDVEDCSVSRRILASFCWFWFHQFILTDLEGCGFLTHCRSHPSGAQRSHIVNLSSAFHLSPPQFLIQESR